MALGAAITGNGLGVSAGVLAFTGTTGATVSMTSTAIQGGSTWDMVDNGIIAGTFSMAASPLSGGTGSMLVRAAGGGVIYGGWDAGSQLADSYRKKWTPQRGNLIL